jgi:hypothetical protein
VKKNLHTVSIARSRWVGWPRAWQESSQSILCWVIRQRFSEAIHWSQSPSTNASARSATFASNGRIRLCLRLLQCRLEHPLTARHSRRQQQGERTRSYPVPPPRFKNTAEMHLRRCVALGGRIKVNALGVPRCHLEASRTPRRYTFDPRTLRLHQDRRHSVRQQGRTKHFSAVL